MLEKLKLVFLPITAPVRFIQRNFKTVVFLTIVISMVWQSDEKSLTSANLQNIQLFGPIITASEVLEKIEEAKNSENIKGVLFEINSPGGAVAPSVEIAYAIKELKKIKPVVAYASGVMASGSYYSAIWADKIIANPGSIVGSIGVIINGMDTKELLDKIGIKPQTLQTGAYKSIGTAFRPWSDMEKKELRKVIDDTYDMFVYDVTSARKLKKQNHRTFANGHIFTALQAKNVGLIDKVATISVAKKELQTLSKIKNPVWKKQDKFDKFMDSLESKFYGIVQSKAIELQAY
ncbi:MAG: endopeptidase IV [Campylobacteraceae bacterium 4484_166]|nr:MAG: endopeptidase IV [Campylobacteraceae bacterium 4484_166]